MEPTPEHGKEKQPKLLAIGRKYGEILRKRIEKLKQWGVSSEDAKEIYKVAIRGLNKAEENASPMDKAAIIEQSIIHVIGQTKYDVVTTQASLGRKIKVRISKTTRNEKKQ